MHKIKLISVNGYQNHLNLYILCLDKKCIKCYVILFIQFYILKASTVIKIIMLVNNYILNYHYRKKRFKWKVGVSLQISFEILIIQTSNIWQKNYIEYFFQSLALFFVQNLGKVTQNTQVIVIKFFRKLKCNANGKSRLNTAKFGYYLPQCRLRVDPALQKVMKNALTIYYS